MYNVTRFHEMGLKSILSLLMQQKKSTFLHLTRYKRSGHLKWDSQVEDIVIVAHFFDRV